MSKSLATFEFSAIATAESCYLEKFGAPRQAGLIPQARALLRFAPTAPAASWREALSEIESFSHLWIVWVFHEHLTDGWKPRVRPPRLGGNQKIGVLATRSPHRPSPIGISAVRLEAMQADVPALLVSGVDFTEGTPILDIRPYVPYADAIAQASSGWAEKPEPPTEVVFSETSEAQVREISVRSGDPGFRELIRATLAQDPAPAFQAGDIADYAMQLRAGVGGPAPARLDIHFARTAPQRFEVRELRPLSN